MQKHPNLYQDAVYSLYPRTKMGALMLPNLSITNQKPNSIRPLVTTTSLPNPIGFAAAATAPRKRRLVVAGAGPPSTTSLIFAFVFPLSLVAVTVFTSMRIADKLDQDFLEELALNQEIMEDEEFQDEDSPMSIGEEPALPRIRNRPKREA
eukprot:TRINITY_DN19394_c0_g1_i1.p1 TRINITY_DN19394_c0_g1~~TRINITY_DN19394_c0_g1_i1.p1  ORF type:complete len:151 (+),score=19.27 TRINITY_DN19394_c0_g1_i1:67-519(+)